MDDADDLESIDAALQQAGRLAEFSEDDLFDELKRRNSATVLLCLGNTNEVNRTMTVWYDGGYWTCLGMAQEFVHDMLHDKQRD